MTLLETYKNNKPCGVYGIANTASILFFEPNKEDSLEYDFISCLYIVDSGIKKFSRNKVHFTNTGKPYINKLGYKIYLSEVMKY